MKLGRLTNPSFVSSLNALNSKELPISVAYKIGKIAARAAEEQKEFFKLRQAAIEKFTVKDAEGNPVLKKNDKDEDILDFGDNEAALEEELVALYDQEVEVPKIPLSLLVKIDFEFKDEMSPGVLRGLKDDFLCVVMPQRING